MTEPVPHPIRPFAALLPVLLLLLALLAGAAQAQEGGEASGRTAVLVLPLERDTLLVKGDPTDPVRSAVRRDPGLELMTGNPPSCRSVPCLADLGRRRGAAFVVSGRLEQLSSRWLAVLHAVDVHEGSVRALVRGVRDGGREERDALLSSLADSLLQKSFAAPGVLVIEATPDSSAIFVDGEAVGFSPVTLQRPAGMEYRIRAFRHGYGDREVAITPSAGDTARVALELERRDWKQEGPPQPTVRLVFYGGLPLDQNESSLDATVGFAPGQSFGASIYFGSNWRIGVGGLLYDGEVDDVPADLLNDINAAGNPSAASSMLYSAFSFAVGTELVSTHGGIGLGVLQRSVAMSGPGLDGRWRSTDFEVGWLAQTGVEVHLLKAASLSLQLLHARTLSDTQSWWSEENQEPPEAWQRAFDGFRAFTVVRLGIGLRL
jgi:hypothetical protein